MMDRRRFVSTLAAMPFLAWLGSLMAETALGATKNLQQSPLGNSAQGSPYSAQNPSPFPNQSQNSAQFPGTTTPQVPTVSQAPIPEGMPEFPKARINRHAILVQNQKNIRKNVDQLYDLAGKLRKQVDETDSSEVLSLDMIQTANQIQKLAKKIVDLAKG